jgi:hypothetical protein
MYATLNRHPSPEFARDGARTAPRQPSRYGTTRPDPNALDDGPETERAEPAFPCTLPVARFPSWGTF